METRAAFEVYSNGEHGGSLGGDMLFLVQAVEIFLLNDFFFSLCLL